MILMKVMFIVLVSIASVVRVHSANSDDSGRNAMEDVRTYLSQQYGIYHSLKDVINFLNYPENYKLPEVRTLINTFSEDCGGGDLTDIESKSIHEPRANANPFVVIEGRQTLGKMRIAHEVARVINGMVLISPAACLRGLEKVFEELGGPLREAYIALSDYALSYQMFPTVETRPCVLTRYWRSHTAFALRKAESDGVNISDASEIFEWPKDLEIPNFEFFIPYESEENSPHPKTETKVASITNYFQRIRNHQNFHIMNETKPRKMLLSIVRITLSEYFIDGRFRLFKQYRKVVKRGRKDKPVD